jgi:hypothetical protein
MAKNAKERQKEYRDRQRLNSVDRRLNLWINSKAYSALERLTEHFKITKREVIEQLIIILDSDVTEIRKLDPIKWDEYFDEKALLRKEIKI